MALVLDYFQNYGRRKHVRPWALAGPIVVLMICLPLLRPLRHPVASQMSDDEAARWATVQALVEQQNFAIDRTQFIGTMRGEKLKVGDVYYSDQPPVLGLLLSGPYWVIYHCGYQFSKNPALVEYLLTLIAVTVPVAAAAGLLYRMGRLFELPRPWRMGLALAVVLGSGMISYATVLNPYAPAAALVLGAAAILTQVAIVNSPLRSGGYLAAAGIFAALAAAIDPAAIVFAILFIAVILALPWRWTARIGGVLMYIIGLTPALLLHASLSIPITGDLRLGLAHLPTQISRPINHLRAQPTATKPIESEDDLSAPPTLWQLTGNYIARLSGAFLGIHGLLTFFPVLIFGISGLFIVLRCHWPAATKSLALVSATGAIIVILRYIWLPMDWRWAMFGVRWYVVFLPLVLFWAGAWLRREHHRSTWVLAGILICFSAGVSLLRATDPMPRDGYDHYAPAVALKNLTSSVPPYETTAWANQ